MSAIHEWLVELYRHDPAFPRAILAGLLVSTVCAVVGCFIVLRRMSFLADAVSHSMLAGVVAGYLLMKLFFNVSASAVGMLIGAMIAGFVTVGVVGFVTRFSRIKEDTAIGVMYTGIFALGGLLASLFSRFIHLDIYHFLVGQILAVSDADLWMMAIVAAAVMAVLILLFRPLQLVSFDRVMAASIGIPVLAIDYLLTFCTSMVVVSGVNIVGVVLVVAMLITPAATAYLLFDRLTRMLWAAAGFGVSGFLLGFWLSRLIGVAPGSAIVVASTGQFLVVLAVAPRYGLVADWLRRARAVPQQLVEDVLGSVLRSEEDSVPVSTVLTHVSARHSEIHRAIRSLVRKDLLEQENGRLSLTDAGQIEARRLLRAHRLWEAYLEHVGTPAEQLHEEAHRLEHLHDEDAVDYLDDKLGHPIRDPHGSLIPEDFVHLVPGTEVKASLLRRGHRGTISAIAPSAADSPLEVGQHFTTAPRQDNGATWKLVLDDGREVLLNHHAADAVTVLLDE
jgi:manganese/iron transport system permease protein/iron/zinc/copper transport system permease protein